jgi:hypothetical protein
MQTRKKILVVTNLALLARVDPALSLDDGRARPEVVAQFQHSSHHSQPKVLVPAHAQNHLLSKNCFPNCCCLLKTT